MLLTDILRFTQVITIFIDNAIKYTKKGTITFGYQLKSNNRIRFFVKDTGKGLSEEELENIFEEYEWAHYWIQFCRPKAIL